MKGKIFTAAIAAVFFVSCATQRNAEKYYQKNPQEFAEKCATAFPVRDSTGEAVIDSTKKADNKDYTAVIDSVAQVAQDLINQERARNIQAGRFAAQTLDSIKAECREVVSDLNTRGIALESRIKQLQASYRPCKSDTVYKTQTVYRENTAKVKSLELQLEDANTKLRDTEKDRDNWQTKARKRFWWIIGLAVTIGLAAGAKLKGWV